MKKLVITLLTCLLTFNALPSNAAGLIHSSNSQSKIKAGIHPSSTVSQKNAVRKAQEYLAYQAFSKKGLIDQLKFEGFSTKDATYAVNHITVNWNKQAAKKAKEYLKYQSFSRSGLIDQLVFEGFTQSQATYGVNKTGL